MTARARRWAVVAVVLLPVAVSGCVRLPDSGPIINTGSHGATDQRPPSYIDPEPPQPGESRLDVVNGFLEAMTAWPISTTVAKEFLTPDAAQSWNPNAAMVVYTNFAPPTDDGGGVRVRMSGAARLDSSGAWSGEVPTAHRTLRFQVVRQHGQYRIANPPDQMVVPGTWFQQRFGEVALYYFDTSAKYLVPEPIFVPLGDQLPTALVSSLVSGPPRNLAGVVRTFLPTGVSISLSVPVTDGIAHIDLVGGRTRPSAQEADLLLAQLAATLRQDAALVGFRVTLNGGPLVAGGSDRVYPVDLDARLMPIAQTPFTMYAVARHRMVGGDQNKMLPIQGPLGTGSFAIDSVAMAPEGSRAVAIVGGGTSAIEAPTSTVRHPRVRTLVVGATALARPTIDVAGRVWLLDRTARGAVIRCWQDGRLSVLRMSGVTGHNAQRLIVSRDGTRLLAVVHARTGDTILGARVATSPDGRVRGLVDPFRIPVGVGRRIADIAWADPTRIAVLSPTRPGSLYQVDILPVDGSTIGANGVSTVIGGHVIGLAGSADPDLPTYAVLSGALVDVRTRLSTALGTRVSNLTYPG
jgi:hypothetical protein